MGAVVAGALAAATLALAPPAYADDSTVTVRGTGLPLSWVGCGAIYDRTDEQPQAYLSRGDAPLGQRSLGYDLSGGTAVGALHVVESMADTRVANLAVRSPAGGTGVAYAGYQEPSDVGTDLMWFGRAELSAPAGRWVTVDATRLSYTWTKYDTARHEVVVAGGASPTSVPAFLAQRRGDGPGLYTIGYGCDGNRFTMDALSSGPAGSVTTYDLEGLTSRVSINAVSRVVKAGEAVTIRGNVTSGSGNRIPHATMLLEQHEVGGRGWRPVEVVDADRGETSVTVRPQATTLYRWRFADRPAHAGSVSPIFAVQVRLDLDEASDEPSPSASPTDEPTDDASPTEPAPSSEASPSPVESASASASLTP